MRLSGQLVGIAALLIIAGSVTARAQTRQQIDWCVNKDRVFKPDLRINGCTAAIQSGRWSGQGLRWAFNNRCWAYNDMGDHDRAFADCNQAIELDPNDAHAYNNRGIAYRAKGDLDRAIADYNEAIRLDPKNAHGYDNRCWARALAGRDLAQALTDCNESLRLRPNNTNVFNSRGLVQLKLGAFDQAIADYDDAVKHNAKDADSLYGGGVAKLKSGDIGGGNVDTTAAKAI